MSFVNAAASTPKRIRLAHLLRRAEPGKGLRCRGSDGGSAILFWFRFEARFDVYLVGVIHYVCLCDLQYAACAHVMCDCVCVCVGTERATNLGFCTELDK